MKRNYLNYSLTELEGNQIVQADQMSSFLIKRVYELQNKKLADFKIEDIRLLIGQNNSLHYLIPLAIEHLEKNVMAEGDYYEGDLLQSVMSISPKFWIDNQDLKERLRKTLANGMKYIEHFNTSRAFKNDLNKFLNS